MSQVEGLVGAELPLVEGLEQFDGLLDRVAEDADVRVQHHGGVAGQHLLARVLLDPAGQLVPVDLPGQHVEHERALARALLQPQVPAPEVQSERQQFAAQEPLLGLDRVQLQQQVGLAVAREDLLPEPADDALLQGRLVHLADLVQVVPDVVHHPLVNVVRHVQPAPQQAREVLVGAKVRADNFSARAGLDHFLQLGEHFLGGTDWQLVDVQPAVGQGSRSVPLQAHYVHALLLFLAAVDHLPAVDLFYEILHRGGAGHPGLLAVLQQLAQQVVALLLCPRHCLRG